VIYCFQLLLLKINLRRYTAVLGAALGRDSPYASREGVIMAVSVFVLLPMSLLRQMKSLAAASILSIVVGRWRLTLSNPS